jgi:hypothetical protein
MAAAGVVRLLTDRGPSVTGMRLLFWVYSAVIASGLVYFIVIGLSHH